CGDDTAGGRIAGRLRTDRGLCKSGVAEQHRRKTNARREVVSQLALTTPIASGFGIVDAFAHVQIGYPGRVAKTVSERASRNSRDTVKETEPSALHINIAVNWTATLAGNDIDCSSHRIRAVKR